MIGEHPGEIIFLWKLPVVCRPPLASILPFTWRPLWLFQGYLLLEGLCIPYLLLEGLCDPIKVTFYLKASVTLSRLPFTWRPLLPFQGYLFCVDACDLMVSYLFCKHLASGYLFGADLCDLGITITGPNLAWHPHSDHIFNKWVCLAYYNSWNKSLNVPHLRSEN